MEVIDFDPVTEVTTSYHYEEKDKKFYIAQEQSSRVLTATVDIATALRNDESYKREGIKKSWMHACTIPASVMQKMYTEYGIKQPLRDTKRVLKIIQRDFPYLMTATGKF